MMAAPRRIVKIPESFVHVGFLDRKHSFVDPRRSGFDEQLDIDMRECRFIRPAALVWCVIYSLLAAARGCVCRLLVPEDFGVCIYLQSVGLFDVLKAHGIEVDDRGIDRRADSQLIVPLTQFDTGREVEELANMALDSLSSAGVGAGNLYPVVSEVFAELALNATQHAESPIGAFGLIQFYDFADGKRFVCVVADGGIGIRRALERNPELRERAVYDWTAIELALQEGVTGTGVKTRGIGLFGVAEEMQKPGRQLTIHSGIGVLHIRGGDTRATTARQALFPGTLATALIPA